MKRRPRRIENRIAAILNDTLYTPLGLAPVERIPILGRTGPDITINQFGLAIDAKSRKSVPLSYLLTPEEICTFSAPGQPDQLGFRLCDIARVLNGDHSAFNTTSQKQSVTVTGWLNHMSAWALDNPLKPTPMLVLHQPGLDVKNSTVLIFRKDWRNLHDQCNSIINQQRSQPVPGQPV